MKKTNKFISFLISDRTILFLNIAFFAAAVVLVILTFSFGKSLDTLLSTTEKVQSSLDQLHEVNKDIYIASINKEDTFSVKNLPPITTPAGKRERIQRAYKGSIVNIADDQNITPIEFFLSPPQGSPISIYYAENSDNVSPSSNGYWEDGSSYQSNFFEPLTMHSMNRRIYFRCLIRDYNGQPIARINGQTIENINANLYYVPGAIEIRNKEDNFIFGFYKISETVAICQGFFFQENMVPVVIGLEDYRIFPDKSIKQAMIDAGAMSFFGILPYDPQKLSR